MQNEDGQIEEPYSVSAGLDYPGIGPIHANLSVKHRAQILAVDDDEALEAAFELTRLEGIIPALESAHALGALAKVTFKPEDVVVLTVSGRGDKDMDTYINYKLELKIENYMMDYTFRTISKKVMGDLHTPVSIYLKVRDIYPESALLESSDFHGNENSLSFIALRPLASIGINNGECTTTFPDETREVTPLTEDYNVPEAMNAFLGRFKVEGADKKSADYSATRLSLPSVISRTSRSWKFITRRTTPPICYTYYISISLSSIFQE